MNFFSSGGSASAHEKDNDSSSSSFLVSSSSSDIPPLIMKNLSDKLYERRKVAALQLEQIIKDLNAKGEHDAALRIIDTLCRDFARSPSANNRKGGLIGLAAATVGLVGGNTTTSHAQNVQETTSLNAADAPASTAAAAASAAPGADTNEDSASTIPGAKIVQAHLALCVPPILDAFADADGRVRYYACEALYNVAKVAREAFVPYFPSAFDALCRLTADNDANVQNAAHLLDRLIKDIVTESPTFDVVEFIPLLRAKMGALNPYVRQFLVGWITLLDSVPDIDMVEFLPDLLDGLFGMLGDAAREIRLQADTALEEFLRELRRRAHDNKHADYAAMAPSLLRRSAPAENDFTRLTAISWLHAFVDLGGPSLLRLFPEALQHMFGCLEHPENRLRETAAKLSDRMVDIIATANAEELANFDATAAMEAAREALGDNDARVRLEALRWVAVLLPSAAAGHAVPSSSSISAGAWTDDERLLLSPLLRLLRDADEEVASRALDVLARLAGGKVQDNNGGGTPQDRAVVLTEALVDTWATDAGDPGGLLRARGESVVLRLCNALGHERVLRCFGHALGDCTSGTRGDAASKMSQALGLIFLTADDARLEELRGAMRGQPTELLVDLLRGFAVHSVFSTASLSLYAGAYTHAFRCLESFGVLGAPPESEMGELARLVALLESPVFAPMRLRLLQPKAYPDLLRALYALLMLLPQGSAFKALRMRLRSVPALELLALDGGTDAKVPSRAPRRSPPAAPPTAVSSTDWDALLDGFVESVGKTKCN
ncbi:hypothetical protein PPROV_000798700 [Pycnococcus provasolii]|uniref:Vacuolar protein 14 C-terminal Fig4-binding domain-containing protein n=1 Tax=Pycnococcus provasolii TaxID=41880 RepID=A0A830HU12_9CHLO|nr:hypothetical protein PPROV_000798700 [Pycnococcus provasolii]